MDGKIFLLAATMLLFGSQAKAQKDTVSVLNSSIKWTCSAITDKNSNDRAEVPGYIKTSFLQPIEWKQGKQARPFFMEVTKADNHWTRLKDDGYIAYNVKFKDAMGVLTISKKSGKVTIELRIEGLPDGVLHLVFETSSVVVL